MEVKLIIKEEEVNKVENALSKLYPIPVNEEAKPLFTKNDWIKEVLVKLLHRDVYRGEQMGAMETAKNTVTPRDDIVS